MQQLWFSEVSRVLGNIEFETSVRRQASAEELSLMPNSLIITGRAGRLSAVLPQGPQEMNNDCQLSGYDYISRPCRGRWTSN